MEDMKMVVSNNIERADGALQNLCDMLFVAADGYHSGNVAGGREAANVLYCIRENLSSVRASLDEAMTALLQMGREK